MKRKLINIYYKVVTKDMKSLGLRRNPNILTYPLKRWYFLSDKKVKTGKNDWGGMWVVKKLSNAKKLQQYMKEKYNKKVRIFKCLIDNILYENSYRTKTNGIKLLEKIND